MFAILLKISMLVFLPLSCQYDNSSSSCSVNFKRKDGFDPTSQMKTSILLLEEIDKEVESVCDSESIFSKNEERNIGDPSDVQTVYEESLSCDVKKEIPLPSGQNLSCSDNERVLEKGEKTGISKYLAFKKKIKEIEEQLNHSKQKIANIQMLNIENHTKKFGEAFEKIKSTKEKALKAEMINMMEYRKRLDETLEKFNMLKEKLKEQKIMNPEILKMMDHQKALREIRDFVQRKYNADVSSSLNTMKRIRETKALVPNPVGLLDFQIERALFKTCNYIDECEYNPYISRNQYRMLKFKKYGAILALPFVIAFSALGFYADENLYSVIFGFAALSFIIFFYILVKILKYDLRSHGIYKPHFMDYVRSFRRCIK
ncbi:Plasmodium exported protein, unknown function [Plasmodium knowlesi strain H]|uniref:Pv-fam-b protein n=3 Tax=Plasmodium knowlesi TaxID=5850 RepID=A0A5K1UWH7_PLAKH|nr:Plasmodium exported protein, unknown function [Plasmodium knowlesi strain H]OTN66884.1 Uncharacterized protein PKNOH_S08508000 [Plasmodium knowlesi]CAA9986651.1 Plasmodium exported protein, unknown function [Plasmodium knowlesi strain H]SBO23454.1 Plasmodium exported protein, unknown function [Plasmodium knowlesi strain H]SBO24885.1 Plasmodium exported protein, unknown function [Plasmodium knowlesi strain H]VVS76125.1 Plasmodium exported protein, unknown function [Plasmodium knowlesi strain|eukprot:XP_002257837.1 hypothetical protein, conserved in Plasmodium species [Plasmodium knowlesi strain H]